MPGILSEQQQDSLKKRKRNALQEESTNLAEPYNTAFIPAYLHTSNPLFRLNCPDLPKENSENPHRHRCIPRKRRVLQQPCHQQNQQPWPGPDNQPTPAKLIAPNLYIPQGSNFASPPVSPKTIVPLSYSPHQQNQCTSAASLRPCHICYRRPTTRELLDAYADCDLCGERACYICLRQCDAIDCRGSVNLGANYLIRDGSDRIQEDVNGRDSEIIQTRKICSCCAVEGMTETGMEVVRCLECVRAHLPQWQAMGQAG
ncbi:uncharacterized protein EURHEDRAFT_378794 [Aspergillus ruber CBS 135680]|uniref:Uncharacterized protein n=1 Tax=Aspergillus ruber (strain CBS 135680) TaxID=1388766 RepID=A0A017S9S2_ASPRC|nr:uncharacterized protein EURHEDRAFT_378794 [Aspergillus ruber CBS 135680]EYE93803.1 hypothetical protein EURHEDRAFT_378794 [Aspergillus ruber CBS 135680]